MPGKPAAGNPVGYTLIELMVAISVIIILVTMAIIAYGRVQERARAVQARYGVSMLFSALESERIETGRVYLDPRLMPGMESRKQLSLDPWKRPILAGPFTTVARSPSLVKLEWLDSIGGLQVRQLVAGKPVESVTLEIDFPAETVNIAGADLPFNINFDPDDPPAAGTRSEIKITLSGPLESGIMIFGYRDPPELPSPLPAIMTTHFHPYLLMSTGANLVPGGDGIDQDIIWRSDYRDFQE